MSQLLPPFFYPGIENIKWSLYKHKLDSKNLVFYNKSPSRYLSIKKQTYRV